ncbi:MAG: hypothetical protein JWP82_1846 [Humibacillus sp.]|nr:hypothetical protein [Humibacillus sp.]
MSTQSGSTADRNDGHRHHDDSDTRHRDVRPDPNDRRDADVRTVHHDPPAPNRAISDSRTLVDRQQEQFGGMKPGSAFFGWLTATGTAVLLTAVISAAGVALGLASNPSIDKAATATPSEAQTVGTIGAVLLAVILFVAYFCGGYVAGRMARFNGAKQGLAVWLWAALIAGLVAVAAAVAGSKYDVLGQINSFPRIPIDSGTLTTGGIIALVIAAVVALVGAILGGIAGMRFHRRIDRATPDLAVDAHPAD